jgi:hypothetical protein
MLAIVTNICLRIRTQSLVQIGQEKQQINLHQDISFIKHIEC